MASRKRASHECRLRDWAAAHDSRSVILSHNARQWSLILVGPRHRGGFRDHVGVRAETIDVAIQLALIEWDDGADAPSKK